MQHLKYTPSYMTALTFMHNMPFTEPGMSVVKELNITAVDYCTRCHDARRYLNPQE